MLLAPWIAVQQQENVPNNRECEDMGSEKLLVSHRGHSKIHREALKKRFKLGPCCSVRRVKLDAENWWVWPREFLCGPF